MNTEHMIEVTKEQIPLLVAEAYNLSAPVGMGQLHYTPEPLSVEEITHIIEEDGTAYMDYVKGRQCKFSIYRDKETNKFYIRDTWYDHSEHQFNELLEKSGVKI